MPDFNILISSAGRRIGLIQCFRQALTALGLTGRVYAIDCSPSSPAFQLADRAWLVPRCTEAGFTAAVLALCEREGVRLIVPTIDPELIVYASERGRSEAKRISVAVSAEETVRLCSDKVRTHAWLLTHGFPTVLQASIEEVIRDADTWAFPVIVKPRWGSASVGVRRVWSHAELKLMADSGDLIVQEVAPGREHTVNVYVDRQGRCRCAVPHLRLEVRGGEVAKGLTVKRGVLMELARRVAESLPGACGPLNIQCFVDPPDGIRVIEINARFGGGYPLTQRAGAWFTRWLIEETLGLPPSASFDDWQDDIAMLRYDEAVYLPGSKLRGGSLEPLVSCI